jgi:hypothetical protein
LKTVKIFDWGSFFSVFGCFVTYIWGVTSFFPFFPLAYSTQKTNALP